MPAKYQEKFAITGADFKLFVVLFNQMQSMSTPAIHLRIAEWLEHRWNGGDKRLLLMAFRSCGKSTLVGLFAAWLLYRNPDLRIMVLAADSILAKKMVRNVKRIIESHPLTAHLKPERADQWASDRFTVKRMLELRDPSMIARGVTSNITGSRADIIICDDVEVPRTCDSAEKRENLREKLAEISYVMADKGMQIYVGTPHHYYSIYADAPRVELGEEQSFLHEFKRLKIPLLDQRGESVWEERFSAADITRIKNATGPNKFNSQMMLRPVNIAEGRLDVSSLRYYGDDVAYSKELRTMFLGERKITSVSAFWDPAFGAGNGDHSVLAIVFADDEGNYFLHHLEYLKTSSADKRDEASQQCGDVAALAKRFMLPQIIVEINGIGRFLPNILRNHLARENVPSRVVEKSSSTAKETRILESFDALLAARRLFVSDAIRKTPFLTEMREWRPAKAGGHDDGLDAAAGAIAAHPDRLKSLYGQLDKRGAYSWMRSNHPQQAKTDFKI